MDPGAHDLLTGDAWAERQANIARKHGKTPKTYNLDKPLNVQGVGKQPQQTDKGIIMPGQFENGEAMTFKAPVLPGWAGPALLGLKSLEHNQGVMDCRTTERKLYLGPDVQVVPGPKTTTLQLYPAMSGHLMLPISCFDAKRKGNNPTLHLHETSTTAAKEHEDS